MFSALEEPNVCSTPPTIHPRRRLVADKTENNFLGYALSQCGRACPTVPSQLRLPEAACHRLLLVACSARSDIFLRRVTVVTICTIWPHRIDDLLDAADAGFGLLGGLYRADAFFLRGVGEFFPSFEAFGDRF